MGLLDDELAKLKRSFGLLGELKLKNDPGVKKLDEFERKLYERSMIYKSLKDAVTAPGRAYHGELDPYSPQAMEEAINVAGMAQLGGIPGGARGPGSVGATVYHGSPHKFNKFDMSKIGTGEGAQGYGHGLYFAESPDVAKSYQSALSADRGFSYGGKTGLTRAEVQDMVNAKYGGGYLDGVIRPSGVADSFIDDMVTGTGRAEGAYPRQYKPGSQRAKIYDELRGQIQHADPGSLYKVDLPDEAIAKMLDWDKPLSEQAPEVQAALQRAAEIRAKQTGGAFGPLDMGQAGRDVVPSIGEGRLREAGIPGIRYLDGGSRSAGEGTSNFVLFDDRLPRILERNGQATGLQPWAPGEWEAQMAQLLAGKAKP